MGYRRLDGICTQVALIQQVTLYFYVEMGMIIITYREDFLYIRELSAVKRVEFEVR
jgi:hypothetical protein